MLVIVESFLHEFLLQELMQAPLRPPPPPTTLSYRRKIKDQAPECTYMDFPSQHQNCHFTTTASTPFVLSLLLFKF